VSQLPAADAAIVSGSGLTVVPDGYEVVDEIGYGALGWPATAVAGHPNRLLVAEASRPPRRLLLACGRAHLYEGWRPDEVERPVRDLAAAGVAAVVLTNATGGLSTDCRPGTAVVVTDVVDLQDPPVDEPPVLPVFGPDRARALADLVAGWLPARVGRYVAVPGPQYETPAEAAWLAAYGQVVGMSAACEVRAARDMRLPIAVLALVVNRAAAPLGHDDVLAAGARLAAGLARALPAVVAAMVATPGAASGAGSTHPGGDRGASP